MIKKYLTLFLVFILGLLVFAWTFWLSIPLPKIVYHFKPLLNQAVLPSTIEINNAETTFYGLGIDSVKIVNPSDNLEILDLTNIKAYIFSPAIFIGKLSFNASLQGGTLHGNYSVMNQLLQGQLNDANLNLNQFVRQYGILQGAPSLNVNYSYSLQTRNLSSNFEIEGISLSPDSPALEAFRPFLPPEFNLSSLTGVVSMNQNLLSVQINFEGDFSGRLEGGIQLNPAAMPNSSMNLRLSGKLSDNFMSTAGPIFLNFVREYVMEKSININIVGSFSNPVFNKI